MSARPGETTGRTARELPPHGTTARAKGRPASGIPGCPCPACRAAENRYNKHRRFLNDTGRPVLVPATPAAEHLRALKAAGMSWPDMVAATGCSSATIAALLRGQDVMRRSVAQRILAVRLVVSQSLPVDATGSVRRVRALYAAGWISPRFPICSPAGWRRFGWVRRGRCGRRSRRWRCGLRRGVLGRCGRGIGLRVRVGRRRWRGVRTLMIRGLGRVAGRGVVENRSRLEPHWLSFVGS